MATACDVVVVVTSRAFLLRYDLSQGLSPGVWFQDADDRLLFSLHRVEMSGVHSSAQRMHEADVQSLT